MRFRKRQRTQQDGVHDREDRRRRADPQRQRDNGDRGEAWFPDEQANRISSVREEISHMTFDGERVRAVSSNF